MTKLIAYGDSIYQGYNGQGQTPSNKRIPEVIGSLLGWSVTNEAISGAQWGTGDKDSHTQIMTATPAGYDYVLMEFGVNNWCFPGGSLDSVLALAKSDIQLVKDRAPNAKVLVQLPTDDYRNGSTGNFTMNSHWWSLAGLMDGIIGICNELGVDYYDWRPNPIITYDNRFKTLGDGEVHPTEETSSLIAQRLADKFKLMSTSSQQPATLQQPTTQPVTQPQPQQQPQIQPVQKATLKRLENVEDLKGNLQENNKQIVDVINKFGGQINVWLGDSDDTKLTPIEVPNTDLSNRSIRNYMFDVFDQVAKLLNDLISQGANLGLMDYSTGEVVQHVQIEPPYELMFSPEFFKQINTNWDIAERAINQLISNFNQTI